MQMREACVMPNRSILAYVCMLLCLAGTLSAWQTASNTKSPTTKDVAVSGDDKWVDTGMDVLTGDKLHITATGTVNFTDKPNVGPQGAARDWKDTLRAFSVPSAPRGALVGQVGNDRAATPFLVGADGTIVVPFGGRLYLGVNQDPTSIPTGSFTAHVVRTPATAAAANST